MEQYMQYIWTALAIGYVIMKAVEIYVGFTASKEDDKKLQENRFYQIAKGVYSFIRKESLSGNLVPGDRLKKAMELLEVDWLKSSGQALSDELQQKAEIAFKAWHADDKAVELSVKKSVAQ